MCNVHFFDVCVMYTLFWYVCNVHSFDDTLFFSIIVQIQSLILTKGAVYWCKCTARVSILVLGVLISCVNLSTFIIIVILWTVELLGVTIITLEANRVDIPECSYD